jgi:hypothetical protein
MIILLQINDGKLNAWRGDWPIPITSVEDLDQLIHEVAVELNCAVKDITVGCSSTLDFPEEYTHDPAVLELVKLVRTPSPFNTSNVDKGFYKWP